MRSGWAAPGSTPLPCLPNQEPVDALFVQQVDEVVAGDVDPALHVGLRSGIIGAHLQQLTHGHLLDGFTGLDDRHRTEQPNAIDLLVSIEDFGLLRHKAIPYPRPCGPVKERGWSLPGPRNIPSGGPGPAILKGMIDGRAVHHPDRAN